MKFNFNTFVELLESDRYHLLDEAVWYVLRCDRHEYICKEMPMVPECCLGDHYLIVNFNKITRTVLIGWETTEAVQNALLFTLKNNIEREVAVVCHLTIDEFDILNDFEYPSKRML